MFFGVSDKQCEEASWTYSASRNTLFNKLKVEKLLLYESLALHHHANRFHKVELQYFITLIIYYRI